MKRKIIITLYEVDEGPPVSVIGMVVAAMLNQFLDFEAISIDADDSTPPEKKPKIDPRVN